MSIEDFDTTFSFTSTAEYDLAERGEQRSDGTYGEPERLLVDHVEEVDVCITWAPYDADLIGFALAGFHLGKGCKAYHSGIKAFLTWDQIAALHRYFGYLLDARNDPYLSRAREK